MTKHGDGPRDCFLVLQLVLNHFLWVSSELRSRGAGTATAWSLSCSLQWDILRHHVAEY
jgi:hypothetical protein